MHPLEKDTDNRKGRRLPLPAGPETAVYCRARDYEADTLIPLHHHPDRHQLVYAETGVLVVRAGMGRWVVPSTRAIWMPAGTGHQVHCIGQVQMRSLYVTPAAMRQPPAGPSAVSVTPLLAALIRAAASVQQPYVEDSRDGRVMRLILDEMQTLPVLPLHLPEPKDARLRMIGRQLERHPDDASTLHDWAQRLRVDVKTIQRLCTRELGMTFGQWRQQARLLRALERLAVGEKVIDVALALGYESPSAFTTMFKRRFGLTPSQFFR
ncbi:helix-turn-helix transcriptional regulator [Stenotrophomonas sp. STM01]|uniref:AraC family transcriptional regulator n=1 Tax=Stenotrophomonas sp. STM01 TaxID=2769278 RepID=UPI00177CF917|nr:helix-turn-helix transcriptional regulator [Stenotrophomonas sp. STM01]MBD9535044.1 helix-turn-helix transcriptional regulator [Stenotrophomonas sp. STM01]